MTPLVLNANGDRFEREFVASTLRQTAMLIEEAATGADALQLATQPVDVIVLGRRFPDMDGVEVCRRLRASQVTNATPILFLATDSMVSVDPVLDLEPGADIFLTPPLNPRILATTTRSLVRLRQTEQLHARQSREALLTADVVLSLNQEGTLCETLQACTAAIVRHLPESTVRVWTIDEHGDTVSLQAGSGSDIGIARLPLQLRVGEGVVGRIAELGQPHVTTDVASDLPPDAVTWDPQERTTAFAGFPLIIEGQTVGVLTVEFRHPLADDTRLTIAGVADALALGIKRKQGAENARLDARRIRQLEQEIESLERLNSLPTTVVTARVYGTFPLRESHPDLFRVLAGRYESLLDLALEQRNFKVDHNVSDELRKLSDDLGRLHAGPRDVIDLHASALKSKTAGMPPQKDRAYVQEGRLLVLELMGHLVSYFRVFKLSAGDELPRAAPDQRNAQGRG